MNEISVALEDATTHPLRTVCEAASLTMLRGFEGFAEELPANSKTVPLKLLQMNHTSIFEHINMRFTIRGASRAFLAQMTRHRIASYTSGSQHYQDFRGFPYIKPRGLKNIVTYEKFMETVNDYYVYLREVEGLAKEEARYVLPNACRNNLEVTINARSLINFLNLRCCNRNVFEMRLIACKMLSHARVYFPELFDLVGPDCTMSKCKQGKMMCSETFFDWPKLEEVADAEGIKGV